MGTPRTPKGRARVIADRLATAFPGSAAELCALEFDGPFQLLAATILSAQCTDIRVNMVVPELFKVYPDAESLAGGDLDTLEGLIRSTGFFHMKAKSLIGMARAVVERHAGEVPSDLASLVKLPGVGRKTGNVVRSVAFGLPGLPVDTHVGRLARRLGLSANEDPVKVEADLCALLPSKEWGAMSLRLILHGRQVCRSQRPKCGSCMLADICPSAGMFEPVKKAPGRQTGRTVTASGR